MKKMFITLLLGAIFVGCLTSCASLPHTHEKNDFGVCQICSLDTSVPFREYSGVLSTGEIFTKNGERVYCRLKPDGVGTTVITLKCGSAVLESDLISVYTKSYANIPLTKLPTDDSTVKKFRCESTLDQNETYYVCFTVRRGGTVILGADCNISDR